MHPTFSDAILNISVTGAVVRIEFATAHAVPGDDGQPKTELRPSQQMVMPLEGFLRSFAAQESVIKQLIAKGALKPAAQPTADVVADSRSN